MTDWLKAIFDLLAIVRNWLARQAGRDAERADALERNAEGKRVAAAAREQAAMDHAAKGDDSAFDQSFRRDDP